MQKDQSESPVVTDAVEPRSSLAELTVEIVSAYVAQVGDNQIASSEVAKLITVVAGDQDRD